MKALGILLSVFFNFKNNIIVSITSKITYLGNLRCQSEHLQSSSSILTDAPTDNHGQGAAFSPTDLCATSLAQCALTTIAILGKSHDIYIEGAYCELQKIMASNPRRISEIVLKFYFSKNHTEKEKRFIEKTAKTCPVFLSLHPDIKKELSFDYCLTD